MRAWNVLLLLVSLVFSGSSLAQGMSETAGNKDQIFTSSGEQLSLETLAARVQQANYVFVGEKHDNPRHHAIERELIRMRFAAKNMSSGSRVVFEMLDESQDNLIAKLQASMNLEEMKTALNWPQKGWDWESYGPLFWESMQNQALSSGNISRALISSIYKDGKNVLSVTPRLASALQQSEGVQKYLLDQIYASHCGMQSRESLQPMLHIQLAKDASMASAMVATPSAMLIAGGEHTRGATGVPQHVQQLKPDASRLIIQLVEKKADKNQPMDYFREIGGADIIWLTEATQEKDYCADVKGRAAQ
ncbi:ChaN family lipoprotein [Undibacterium cyanobacteriorum]|uniref:ChaN family lipoprotein n=1 Tax=Undibacterium cyanobacteriorum TaxID=3073561 RepID=A0ABY9RFK4_9BURK|nr:ChaN family lipoprotein [Undibacterium sp. 20NA77.5]WMW79002.1 ChaN family lipoprotein [Undibacterium sp. 20NA77.5]